jgi:arginase
VLVQLIHSSNDSGHIGARMGLGPARILAAGAAERLTAEGRQVETIRVEPRDPFPTETSAAFETARVLARQVRMAVRQRRFPIVLAGNCMAAVGAVSGLPRGRTGLVWLDAHADFNTPETTRSGFLDGMALAAIVGHCWTALTASVPDFEPLRTGDVLLLGARDVEAAERARLEALGVEHRDTADLRADPAAVAASAASLGGRADRVHLHVDLDVLDPDAVAPANRYAASGGLTLPELLEFVRMLRRACRIGAVTIASYDPAFDREHRMCAAALDLLSTLTEPDPYRSHR